MMNSDLLYSVRNIEGVRDAAPYLLYRLYDQKLKCEIALGGVDTNSVATQNNVCAKTNLVAGKFMSDKPGEVVAEESFAMAHKLTVGDTLVTYGDRLKIAGIINSGIKPGKADLYAPIENVRTLLRDKLQCISPGFDMNIILVEVKDARVQPCVMNEIREKMNYLSLSSYNCYQPATDVMDIMSRTTSILSVIIFIFLIIFSAKTQLTTLMERFREIGILKSLGWSNRTLSLQIFAMSVIQALTGAVLGIVTGFIIVRLLYTNNIRLFDLMEFRINATSPLFMIILSVAGGLIAAVFPVIKLHRSKAGEMINNFL
jgi:putative ABC transport system permease protein